MRLHRVRLRNFRGVEDSEVAFPDSGVVIIEGDNEVGKSSIAEAIDLILTYQDSSSHRRIKAVQPNHRDEGAEVEIEMSTGPYRFVYAKRWHRQRHTTLDIVEPIREQLTGREAHEKVEAILAETVDLLLWESLRLRQGAELAQGSFDVTSLGRALDLAAGGDQAGDREGALWERVTEERDRYWTATWQVKVDRVNAAAALEAARSRVALIDARLRSLDEATEEVARLADQARGLEAVQLEHLATQGRHAEQLEAVTQRRSEVRQLGSEVDAARAVQSRLEQLWTRRLELVDEVDSRAAVLAKRTAEMLEAQPAKVAAAQRRALVLQQLAIARDALGVAELDHHVAAGDSDHRRHQIELEQLTERHDRVVDAQRRLSDAEAHLETARVDDERVRAIEAAHLSVARAEAALSSGAASVMISAMHDVELTVGDHSVHLAAGEDLERAVSESFDVVIPDVALVRVRAGAEARALSDRLDVARAEFARLCQDGGVADLDGARAAASQRAEADRTRVDAVVAIKQDLRDLTLDALAQKTDRLTLRIADYERSRPAEPPLPKDLEAAQALVATVERVLADRRDEVARLEDQGATADAAASEAALGDAGLAALIEQATAASAQSRRSLADARAELADDEIRRELVGAESRLSLTERSLASAQAALAAEDPETLDVLMGNARAAVARSVVEIRTNQDRRQQLQVLLELQGEDGLAQQRDGAMTELDHLQRNQHALEARAVAAKLLYDTLAARRDEARNRYVAPFRDRIQQLGRIVFGPSLEVELDTDLSIRRRTLDGVTCDFEQLSTGAQEQLGILGRLACAVIVSDEGGAPVIFDDALGWTDPHRLERMGAAIAQAGQDAQVIVLTCTPGRYASVGTASTVRLVPSGGFTADRLSSG